MEVGAAQGLSFPCSRKWNHSHSLPPAEGEEEEGGAWGVCVCVRYEELTQEAISGEKLTIKNVCGNSLRRGHFKAKDNFIILGPFEHFFCGKNCRFLLESGGQKKKSEKCCGGCRSQVN